MKIREQDEEEWSLVLISERGPCLQDKATWEQNSKLYHSNRKDKQGKMAKRYFIQGRFPPPVACVALKTEEASLENTKMGRRDRCHVNCSQSCSCCAIFLCLQMRCSRYQQESCMDCATKQTSRVSCCYLSHCCTFREIWDNYDMQTFLQL